MTASWTGIPVLQGSLVRLAPLRPGDEDRLWPVAADPRIWEWMTVRAGASREAFATWMRDALAGAAAGSRLPFLISAASGQPVGSTSYLNLAPEDLRLEIGHTWMAPSTWRTGINREAKLLLLKHAFDQLGARRVEIVTDSNNARSRAAIEGIGGTFEGILRKHRIVRGGERRDTAVYSIIDDDWPAVRRRLEERRGST